MKMIQFVDGPADGMVVVISDRVLTVSIPVDTDEGLQPFDYCRDENETEATIEIWRPKYEL